ncbi:hypothetical protein GIB67_010829 [Kingdonia uniflora]|uniref:Uncharacterized protein n=1 Tax=Kingdonia uniflora TaxID=39325 RepID=A0A7J7L933_9MAGN|nr:hypothetical protein GIB67_010829 [Kingdonia uniflora]
MASSISSNSSPLLLLRTLTPITTTNPLFSPTSLLYFSSSSYTNHPRFYALKAASDGPDLRKPVITSSELSNEDGKSGDEDWVDWEDQILEDTVPLVGFVRMILHSGTGEERVALYVRSLSVSVPLNQ